MSKRSPEAPEKDSPDDAQPRAIFKHEVRRGGRTIATLQAHRTESGVTVDSEVFPITHEAGEAGLKRPFTFGSLDHARRFTDEALVVFEYLDCTVS